MSLLRDLQAIDSYIDRLRQELKQLDSGERIRAKLEQSRQRMEDIKARYKESYAIATEQERRLQEFDERIRRAEADLYSGRITNPRELQLMQQEIEQREADARGTRCPNAAHVGDAGDLEAGHRCVGERPPAA
jgi:predicted  nucleic acid-binding Zn-ribbon protein